MIPMQFEIHCRDTGPDCPFVARAETVEEVVNMLMRHVRSAHECDWFAIEEIHQAARTVIRGQAA